jgi:predicted methyltransferase
MNVRSGLVLLLGFALALGACGGEGAPPSAPSAPSAPSVPTAPTGATPSSTSPPKSAAPSSEKFVVRYPSEPGEIGLGSQLDIPPAIRAVVDAADRDPEDRKLDAGRKPAELLTFAGIKPGMKVADLGAGRGYTTELLARAVGPSGVVYGQNTAMMLEKFLEKPWSARLAKPINKNVVKVTRDADDPLPPEAKDLDAAIFVLLYHDTFWMKADQAKMNAAVFRALKPGGVYVIVDHSGKAGTGTTEVQTLHRIEESVVRKEVTAAGFKLATWTDVMRRPDDTKDWNTSPMAAGEKRGTSDRFVLKFVKP